MPSVRHTTFASAGSTILADAKGSWSRIAGRLGWAAAALAVVVGIAVSPDIRHIAAGAIGELTLLAVLVTVPVQIAATLLCAAALAVLGPGVTFWGSVASRLLRDAGGNLLVLVPGLGELIGARSLVLSGGTARAAVAASALDVIAETLAQIPFICLALLVLPRLAEHIQVDRTTVEWLGIGVLAALALAAIALFATPRAAMVARLRGQIAAVRAEWRQRRGAMPLAILLHLLAWAMGGIQVWLSARALGFPLNLFDAIVLESAAYAVRAILFLIPAGIGVQEAGFIMAGLAFGLTAEQALALSLVLRLRDALLGVPVLLAWPVAEWRRRTVPDTVGAPRRDG